MTAVRSKPRWSLEALGLGARAYVIFLLASVFPLALIAVLVDRYVLPQLPDAEARGAILASVAVAVLAILAFVVLVRATGEAVGSIRAAHDRLAILLEAGAAVGGTFFRDLIVEQAARAGGTLLQATAGFLFRHSNGGGESSVAPTTVGEVANRVLAARREALDNLAVAACRDQQLLLLDRGAAALVPGLLGPGPDGLDVAAALAAPLVNHGRCFGALLYLRGGGPGGDGFSTAESDALLVLARQTAAALHNAELKEAEKNFFTHATEILVRALDLHVRHQAGHSHRVARISLLIAAELELDPERRERLFFSALLHDIGLLKIDPADLSSRDACRDHSRLGGEMLAPITVWSQLAPLVRHHHEHHDGQGYPDGLAGEAIPLESRIIAVADAFDVLTAASSYRETVSTAEALAEIEGCAGTQFDERVVKGLLAAAERGSLEG